MYGSMGQRFVLKDHISNDYIRVSFRIFGGIQLNELNKIVPKNKLNQ